MKNNFKKFKAPLLIFFIIVCFAVIDSINNGTSKNVSKDKYDSIVTKNNEMQDEIRSKDSTIRKLNETIDSLTAEIESLKTDSKTNSSILNDEGEGTPSTTTEKVNNESSKTESTKSNPLIPIVTYNDILSNKYANYVYIDGIIDNYEKDSLSISFDLWYPYNDSYIIDRLYTVFEDDSLYNTVSKLSSGDSIRLKTSINDDSSFGISNVESIEKIKDIASIKSIKKSFKNHCKEKKYSTLLRKPDSYWGTTLKFSGEVFQIIEQSNNSVELLLDIGNDQYVHINYTNYNVDSRILEGDSITVYGYFYKLCSYTTLLGSKKEVPELATIYLDINN